MSANETIQLIKAPPDFRSRWAEVSRVARCKEDNWIEKLRAEGVKAAHPDDGWVCRAANCVHFAYAQFNDGVSVGDKIALGCASKWRIVVVTEIKDLVGAPIRCYFFDNESLSRT